MRILLAISLVAWLGLVKSEDLQVISSTIITNETEGCLQSGRLYGGFFQTPMSIFNFTVKTPSGGLCPNGSILGLTGLVGESISLDEIGLFNEDNDCVLTASLITGRAQSALPLLPPSSTCNNETGVYLKAGVIFDTVVADQLPFKSPIPVSLFQILNDSICFKSANILHGLVILNENSGLIDAVYESCPAGYYRLNAGILTLDDNRSPQRIYHTKTQCIRGGDLYNGIVIPFGERVALGSRFKDGTLCDPKTPFILVLSNLISSLIAQLDNPMPYPNFRSPLESSTSYQPGYYSYQPSPKYQPANDVAYQHQPRYPIYKNNYPPEYRKRPNQFKLPNFDNNAINRLIQSKIGKKFGY